MSQISIVGTQARDKALKGAKYVAEAVKSTLGPWGMNALIEKGDKITNDGYIISQQLCPTIKDEFERRGALVAHQASAKTNDMVGDATSSAWALTHSIINEAIRYLPNEKSVIGKKTPSEVAKMIEQGRKEVIEKLKETVTPITDEETLIKSALVSVEDEELANLLGSTQWKLGADGVIIAEEVNDTSSSIEVVKGIRIDNGFSNSTVINNQEKQSLELSDFPIILTNYTIGAEEIAGKVDNKGNIISEGVLMSSVFRPLINQKAKGIIIMARAFTSEAIKLCMETTNRGFAIYPVNAPYTEQAEIMKDLQAVLGGRYIDSEEGKLEDIYISDVGFCKRMVARRFDAIFTGNEDEKATERVEKRLVELRAKLAGSQSDFEKKLIETRIAQFTNGFAILKVGSVSLVNRKRLKDKCDDAVNAVRLALKGGTVPGAGLAFKAISEKLSDDNILKRPICVINDQIMSSAPEGWTVEEWVRDPYIVLECALTNACDVSSTFATTNMVITSSNPKECKCDTKSQSDE